MSSRKSSLMRGAMLGAASGILSQSGLATVLVRTPRSNLPGFFRHSWVKRLSAIAAAGEVTANILVTSLPPRTDPTLLAGRVAMGGLAGGLAGRGPGSGRFTGTMAGALVAPVGAWASTNSRAHLSRILPDKLVAVAETVIAFGLARLATR